MKKLSLVLILTFLIFSFILTITPPASAANNTYIDLYNQFLDDMANKKFDTVWSTLSVGSKSLIARAIVKEMKGQMTETQVLDMLEKNTENVRTIFMTEFEKNMNFKEIKENSSLALKSTTATKAIVTITYQGKPDDFSLVKEGNVWKINFFADLDK
jgi:hypothetical protein